MTPQRYALYFVPDLSQGWAQFCTNWLGWDATSGQRVDHPAISGLDLPIAEVTQTPRKYGLHATIKPPFRLAEGTTFDGLDEAVRALTTRLSPVTLEGLMLSRLGRFLALTPAGTTEALDAMAADVVRSLDAFRRPAEAEELARRRAAGLSPAQEQNLTTWGYPHVMECFRFHITLSGKLPKDQIERVEAALQAHLAPLLPAPFEIKDLAIAGEDADGVFHLIKRYPLRGG